MVIEDLRKELREFARQRDWEKFHTPKNLAMALSVEVAEVVEIFQWMKEQESTTLDESRLRHLKEEIGDVFIYLVNLADKFGIDPLEAAMEKLRRNREKYPADVVRGKAAKYTEYLKT
ncbi:NTP Pyrophosphohydrolase MazG-like protein [Candidatus Magnetobacterium bavaricum]|uniref:NTP Pyrophosphohydrolase MazG-like protein n=1 Tax=Candidatus Magnetobacterium bavaricum TaxID=29290 RepID=A0A0F3GTG1_9BACT|nr:NTP Pyrophosphohydrolase MazG-like protein [Candidatus Magnetobacterium bavaricum]